MLHFEAMTRTDIISVPEKKRAECYLNGPLFCFVLIVLLVIRVINYYERIFCFNLIIIYT